MTRIVTEDAEGRVVDLHAMRTTLGKMLSRQGIKASGSPRDHAAQRLQDDSEALHSAGFERYGWRDQQIVRHRKA